MNEITLRIISVDYWTTELGNIAINESVHCATTDTPNSDVLTNLFPQIGSLNSFFLQECNIRVYRVCLLLAGVAPEVIWGIQTWHRWSKQAIGTSGLTKKDLCPQKLKKIREFFVQSYGALLCLKQLSNNQKLHAVTIRHFHPVIKKSIRNPGHLARLEFPKCLNLTYDALKHMMTFSLFIIVCDERTDHCRYN